MGMLILVILITVGTGWELRSFETRLNEASQAEYFKDVETYKLPFPFPLIAIQTRCEPGIGNKPEMQETGV